VFPPDTENTPYLRHAQTCQATPSTCYEPLLTGAPGYADVPEGTKFGEGEVSDATVVGGTPDLSHLIVRSGTSLSEWSAAAPPTERLRPVSVLPAGGGTLGGKEGRLGREGAGEETANARWAVSADGSRVVWTWVDSNGDAGLYLRVNATEPQSAISAGHCTEPARACTIRVDTVQGGSGNGQIEPEFQIATKDDSRIFFSDDQQLLQGASFSRSGGGDLYECEVLVESTEPRCVLHDVALGTGMEHEESTQSGVLGASEDGSYLYFVSSGLKLYMVHYDAAAKSWEAPVFIATLSQADSKDWQAELTRQTARVSPDGKWLAFMSSLSLTGYDNHDAHSGQPDEEVFLYNGETHRLVCASCNPTGGRPHGVLDVAEGGTSLLADHPGIWGGSWLGANIPSWNGSTSVDPNYQPRYLSDSGRLFFNSSDALVPQDVNGTEDVYEWEPAGVGGCTTSLSTFNPATGGCISLISSGTSAAESAFLDASESGNDVFFLTAEKLVSQHIDTAAGAFDVYDAHVCSPASPCPASPVAPPECVTADACRAAPSPQPGVFGAPASATFSGAGNVAPTQPAAAAPKTAAQLRAEKLARALRACRSKRDRRRRAACERQARRLHGTAANAKQSGRARRAGYERRVK
jgi:hypothetical protein